MKWLKQIFFYELQFEVARSGGPGGQHVNRTNSAAILRWNLPSSQSFNEDQKRFLAERLAIRLSNSGDLIIRSQEFRNLEQNKRRCLEKLNDILEKAFHIPKKRKATKPTKSSKEKRRKLKKRRSDIKKSRNPKNW